MTRQAGPDVRVASGFFVLRTPLLSRDEIDRLSEGLEAPTASHDGLRDALSRDRVVVRERLARWFESPILSEALFVASPKLHGQLASWLRDPEGERGKKIERTLVRYFSRIAARSTPFGLFAGCSVGSLGEKTNLVIGGVDECARHARLDMEYVTALAARLETDPELRRHLTLRPNSSLYEAGGRLRYAEAGLEGRARSYRLVGVEATDYLLETLQRASGGATFDELAEGLIDDEISRAEAEEYIDALFDNQILESDLAPKVTGGEPIDDLIARLKTSSAGRSVAGVLDDVNAAVEKINERPLGVEREEYDSIVRRLEELPVEVDPARLFQVDMTRSVPDLCLGPPVVSEITRAIEVLRRVSEFTGHEGLDRFRRDFVRRYEGRTVPLLEALDEDFGIGFTRSEAPEADASPLLEGVHFPGRAAVMQWRPRHGHLLELLCRALEDGSREIELSDADVEALASDEPPTLPAALAVSAVVAAESESDIDRGRFSIWVNSVYGPSGARLLGRFCHADPELHSKVLDHLRTEDALHADALFAEIVHLPEGRVGNVLLRPVLRDYEIPYLGRSGAPIDKQIPVSDLTVTVVGRRVVLRSRRLGKEVIPRLTSALNYTWQSLGVYRFLCALQNQEAPGGVTWHWGPLERAPFLPRVTYGRTVLSRAMWHVDASELAALNEGQADTRFTALQEWRRRRGVPRFVTVADLDNELLVDLDNVVFADSFLQLVSGRAAVRLVEAWPDAQELPVSGDDGRYVSEIVVPFVAEERTRRAPRPSSDGAGTRRAFVPGSQWLYAKLYAGESTIDRVLCDEIAPLVERLRSCGAIDGWFFVRYSDPDWHLRVRFHLSAASSDGVESIYDGLGRLVDGGLAWKLQFDTYEREVERYGGGFGIELAEQLFAIDSDAVLEVLPLLLSDETADARWRIALYGVHALLEDFGLSSEVRTMALRGHRDLLMREFDAGGGLRRQLGQKYRQERSSIERLIEGREPGDPVVDAGVDAVRARSEKLRPTAGRYRELEAAGALTHPLHEVVMSFAHMHVNRMLRSSHRAQELVMYDLLERVSRSIAARS